ncbi:MAG: thioredoxin [Clostridiaceae bacterium]|nr:thioredoxin [Clostridiaceae bacterium]
MWLPRVIALLIAVGFIVAGVNRQEVRTVLVKAIRVCLECIGLS